MALQVYTASLLKEGLVAYLCMEEENAYWSTDIRKAAAVGDDDIQKLKAAADRSERENIIVAPYAIDVDLTEQGLLPTTKREQIRANGPTIIMPVTQAKSGDNSNLRAA